MWILKLKLPTGNQFIGSLAAKHNVRLTGYPLSYWKEGDGIYTIVSGFLFGEEKNKKSFIKEAKKLDGVKKLEVNKDFIIAIVKQPKFSEPIYDPEIIRVNPVIINEEGFHIWELASFDRNKLEKVLDLAEKNLSCKLIKFREEKLSNISLTKLLPDLSKNQKRAMELAINYGYYKYPKKIKMEDLAKKMEISYSTFQAHLKKAEGKLIPKAYSEWSKVA